jgi:hypothetical protein
MKSRLAKRTRVKRKKKSGKKSRKRNIRNKEGLSLPGQEKLRRASKRFTRMMKKVRWWRGRGKKYICMMQMGKRRMVYTDACNQAECVKRNELAIAVVSVARTQESVVMVALQRQC